MSTLPMTQLLTAEDEVDLARRIEAGVFADHLLNIGCPAWATPAELEVVRDDGEAAWQRFYSANLRLAALVANRWAARFRIDADDVLQDCCIALGGAIRAWDWKRGTRFSTLAWRRLTTAAQTACLQRGGGGGEPDWWLRAHIVVGQLATDKAQRGVIDPIEATAAEVGRPPSWVRRALAWAPPRHLSDADDLPGDVATDAADVVWARLCHLGRPERDIVERRFGFVGEQASYRQIADDLDLTPTVVKRLETQALAQLGQVCDDLPLAA